jgi:DNA-binding cell septation regulator SpoVG
MALPRHQSALPSVPSHNPPRVTSITAVNRGNMVAIASVDLECGVVTHDWRLIMEAGKNFMWVSCPVREFFDKAGKKRFAQMCTVDPALKETIDALIIDAYQMIAAMGEVGHV